MVDDLELTRDYLRRTLEGVAGFRVLTAATVEAALKTLDYYAVDVVVADLRLAGHGAADGGHLLDAVGKWHRGTARILTTADFLGETMAREGGYRFHDKTLPVAELVRLIREVVPRA